MIAIQFAECVMHPVHESVRRILCDINISVTGPHGGQILTKHPVLVVTLS